MRWPLVRRSQVEEMIDTEVQAEWVRGDDKVRACQEKCNREWAALSTRHTELWDNFTKLKGAALDFTRTQNKDARGHVTGGDGPADWGVERFRHALVELSVETLGQCWQVPVTEMAAFRTFTESLK